MIKAYCDRCKEEIPDYNEKESQITLVNGEDFVIETFDFCPTCYSTIFVQITDFIKRA